MGDGSEHLVLEGGRVLLVRPITLDDAERLRSFHHLLSDRTTYQRYFMPKPDLSERELRHLTNVDQERRVAVVATEGEHIVAVARFDDLGDGSAEAAFVVRDDLQGQGVGGRLLAILVREARARGLRRLVAETLPSNAAMIAVFEGSGLPVSLRRVDDIVEVSLDLG